MLIKKSYTSIFREKNLKSLNLPHKYLLILGAILSNLVIYNAYGHVEPQDSETNISTQHPSLNQEETSTPKCQYVVTLTPELTELTASLVKEDQIVGTDLYSNYPAFTQSLPKIADYYTIYRERLLKLKYNCIFAGPDFNSLALKTTVSKLPGSLHSFSLKSTNELINAIDVIAKLTGASKETARNLSDSLTQSLKNTESLYSKPPKNTSTTKRIALVVWGKPLTVVGGNNHLSEFSTICGYQNAFADINGYPTISLEQLYVRKVDKIINLSSGQNVFTLNIKNLPEARFEDPDILVRLTPRAITKGLPKLCQLLN